MHIGCVLFTVEKYNSTASKFRAVKQDVIYGLGFHGWVVDISVDLDLGHIFGLIGD